MDHSKFVINTSLTSQGYGSMFEPCQIIYINKRTASKAFHHQVAHTTISSSLILVSLSFSSLIRLIWCCGPPKVYRRQVWSTKMASELQPEGLIAGQRISPPKSPTLILATMPCKFSEKQ